MEFYLYSHQDLIVKSDDFKLLKADVFYRLQINVNENIFIYSTICSGSIVLNYDILQKQKHGQIHFYKLNLDTVLCEIKPFSFGLNRRQFIIGEGVVDVFDAVDSSVIYFNNSYYGVVDHKCLNIQFQKVKIADDEYGVVEFYGDKNLIIFNKQKIVYCGQYIDKEITKNNINIYLHIPNIFNTGQLIKCDCLNHKIAIKTIKDNGEQCIETNNQFTTIYFIEALKCGRYKYAHSKLSYELKSEITGDVLAKYFGRFDKFYYLAEHDVYITFCANKIVGVYHIDIKNNMIYNIY